VTAPIGPTRYAGNYLHVSQLTAPAPNAANAVELYEYRTKPIYVRSGPGDLDLNIYGLHKFSALLAAGNPTKLMLPFCTRVRGGAVPIPEPARRRTAELMLLALALAALVALVVWLVITAGR
jgi:hypothetical protein